MSDQDGPVGRLRISNDSDGLLELVVEPYGRDHWLNPGETFVVWTVGAAEGEPWPGYPGGTDPFEVDYRVGSVTVHVNGRYGYVEDADGREIACGHQRP